MLITVINHHESGVGDDDLLDAIRDVNLQIDHDFRPYWNLSGELRLGGKRGPRPMTRPLDILGDAIIFVFNERRKDPHIDPWTAGYHVMEPGGIPTAYIYARDGDQTEWQLSLSHEALELIAHPFVNLYVRGPHPDPDVEWEVFHSYEVCDAVKEQYYLVDSTKVSNFLLPLYFTRDGHDAGRVVFRHQEGTKPLESFGLSPGGYVPFFDPQRHRSFHYHLIKKESGEYAPQVFEATQMAQYHPWKFEDRKADMVPYRYWAGRRCRRSRSFR